MYSIFIEIERQEGGGYMATKKPKTPPDQPTDSRVARRKLEKLDKKRAKKERIKNLPRWRKALRFIRKTISALIVIGVVLVSIVAAIVWNKYGDLIRTSVTEGYEIAEQIKRENFIQRQPTIVYDKDKNVIKEFKQYEYDAPVYEEINPYFLEGVVAIEDKRFYLHHGVDLYGTARSIASTFIGGDVQGGSTITQQLVRNVILEDRGVSIERKLKEQVVAQQLEKQLSKEEILTEYLNNVYFGHGNYGIGTASKYYFGKDQSELTVGEVAVIIGITNNPSLFDPITNPENALKKRNRLLNTFLEAGIIHKKEYDKFVKKPIELDIHEHNIDNRVSEDYALSFAVHKATEDLMKSNGFVFQYIFDTKDEYKAYHQHYQEEYDKHRQKIIMGGYEIYTGINQTLQKELEKAVERNLQWFPSKTQVAITTVDNKTGEVVAIVGGHRDKDGYFNRAYQGVRQPGSTAKPIVAYANAFEKGYRPQSTVVDSAIKNGPRNVYRGYRGNMSVRYAIEQSVNTVAYKLANQVGYGTFLDKLERMEFQHLTPEDANPIISVGGFTKGVTTVEMAGAFSTFTRHGDFLEPTNIREIKDIVTKETIVKNDYQKTKVFQEDAAYMMVDTLKGVITNGTGKSARLNNYPHVFGKTGTTNENKDSYFVGGTPYYTTAIWTGYDMPSTLSQGERLIPMSLFKDFMTYLHKGKKIIDFEMPKSVYRSGNALHSSLETYEKLQATREANEEIRLNNERKTQRERLALEDYRIIHGLTSGEEKERERKTEEAIQKAQNFVMVSVDDYEEWMQLIAEARRLNENVKHQAAYDAYLARINELEVIASTEKQRLIAEIERQKEEERRLEEQRRKEAEQIEAMQKELNGWMERINKGESLTETEFRSLEQLVQNLKNKGVEVPNIQVEWIEPEKTEEELVEENEETENSTSEEVEDTEIKTEEESPDETPPEDN